jgi:hypothetical protein
MDDNLKRMDAVVSNFFDQWVKLRHRAIGVHVIVIVPGSLDEQTSKGFGAGDPLLMANALLCQAEILASPLAQKEAHDDARAREGLPEQARKPRKRV